MAKEQTEQTKIRSLEIAFDESSWARIQELKRKAKLVDAPNGDLHLIRRALMCYEWYMDQIAAGAEVGVVKNKRLTTHSLKFGDAD